MWVQRRLYGRLFVLALGTSGGENLGPRLLEARFPMGERRRMPPIEAGELVHGFRPFKVSNLPADLWPPMPQETLFHNHMSSGMLLRRRAGLPKDLDGTAPRGELPDDGRQPVNDGVL